MHAYEMSNTCQHMSTPPTQLPHKFAYIVAILIHNNFELPNTYAAKGLHDWLIIMINDTPKLVLLFIFKENM
jgi:hypothetical protein